MYCGSSATGTDSVALEDIVDASSQGLCFLPENLHRPHHMWEGWKDLDYEPPREESEDLIEPLLEREAVTRCGRHADGVKRVDINEHIPAVWSLD